MRYYRIAYVIAALLAIGSGMVGAQSDAETERYLAELQKIGIEGSMFDIQSRAFAAAAADKRVQMWQDLETTKELLATDEMAELLEIRAQIEATQEYDSETLRYKNALQQAGKSAEEVNGLVTLFSNGTPLVRQALLDDLNAQ